MRRVRHRALHAALILAGVVIVVAGLSAARDLLVPLTLATLLSFLLAPLADRLEHWHIPRVPAVLLVTLLAFSVMAAVGYVVVLQSIDLIASLPSYRRNIDERVEGIQERTEKLINRASRDLQQFQFLQRDEQEEEKPPPGIAAPTFAPDGTPTEAEPELGSPSDPMVVRIQEPALEPVALLRDYAGTVLRPLALAALVVLFVIFMLLQRDDLRDRIIRLIGQRRIYITSHALNDAGRRISRYLLMQLIINLSYGIPVGFGLWLMGMPGAALWGLLATVLRFIPYLGPWLGASLPILLSLAVFPGWVQPLIIAGFFVVIELFSNNVMEPWLYGSTTGMSTMAVILAATFWSWLWGPVGLLLAIPITACLVVAGQHIPPLRFFAVMLGDKMALDPHVQLYQQLAEMDEEEPLLMVRQYAAQHSRLELYDNLLLPALHLTEQERHRGWLEQDRQQFIRESMQKAVVENATSKAPQADAAVTTVACVGARDVADALSALMLADLLRSHEIGAATITRTQALRSAESAEERPSSPIIIISALPPSAASEALALLRALRQGQPDARVVVGLWHRRLRHPAARRAFRRAGATAVVHSFGAALDKVHQLLGIKEGANEAA